MRGVTINQRLRRAVAVVSAVWGIALGLIIVASTQAIVGNAPVERAGVAGGMQQTGNQLGGVIGTSVLGSVIVSGVGSHLARTSAPPACPTR